MMYFTRAKTLTILAICLVGLLIPLTNFMSKDSFERLPSWLQNKIGLGLDLRGGAHLLLSMNTDELKRFWLDSMRDEARTRLLDKKIPLVTRPSVAGETVQIRVTDPAQTDAAVRELRALAQPLSGTVFGGSGAYDREVKKVDANLITLSLPEPALLEKTGNAISAAIEVVRRRVDALGNKEANVVPQGRDRILVQVPGIDDTRQLKDLLGQTAKMTFQLVHPSMSADEARATRAPAGYRIIPSSERGGGSLLIDERVIVSGEDLVDAQAQFDNRNNEWVISFRFNTSGGRKFGKATQENVGRPFAIVVDNGIVNGQRDVHVISAPVIREPILGGSGQISGSFTPESATRLGIQLRSGALPATLTVVEERVVGASLGQDSIEAGKRAALIGMIAVAGFMIFAYGLFGVFAVIGAALHVILVVAIMTVMGSTLTLPGIGGIVLTIGMAVDANVLIYERIREELRNGRTPLAAIDAGFRLAYATIIDSQLTTFIAGIVMFMLGSGPIRGFAVTLTLGILTTVFTAFTVTRLLVAWWLTSQNRKAVPAPL